MNRKQLFMVLGVLLFLCMCVAGLAAGGLVMATNKIVETVDNSTDPENVKKIASTIADFTVPDGYSQAAIDLVMFKYVMLTPKDQGMTSGPIIMLMAYSSETGLTNKEIQEQMQRSFERQTGQQAAMKEVETRTMTIRGQDVPVTILEGKQSNGYLTRRWVTVFEGKTGPVVLIIQGYPGKWKDKLIEGFISSIK